MCKDNHLEDNKALVRRLFDEAINQDNQAALADILAEEVLIHDPLMGTISGQEAFHQLKSLYEAAFSQPMVTIDLMLAEGEYVAVLHTHHPGNPCPDFQHQPAACPLKVCGFDLYRVVGGKIVEYWRKDDDRSLVGALEAVGGPEQRVPHGSA